MDNTIPEDATHIYRMNGRYYKRNADGWLYWHDDSFWTKSSCSDSNAAETLTPLQPETEIPEGATHKNGQHYYKMLGGRFYIHMGTDIWILITASKKWIEQNLTPLQPEPTQWIPEVDTECEAKIDGAEWIKVKYIGINTVGSKVYAVVFIPCLSTYDNYKIDDNLTFRPLKTEREKFIERSREGQPPIANDGAYEKILGAAYDKGARFND